MKLRGHLVSKAGDVSDGLYDLTFAAYDGLDGKVELGSESRSVAVFAGVFTAALWEPPEKPPDAGKGSAYVEVVVGKAKSQRVEIDLTAPASALSPFDVVRSTKKFVVDYPIDPLTRLANKTAEMTVVSTVGTAGIQPVSVRVAGRHAFVGAGGVNPDDGSPTCLVQIFDVSDPLAPGLVASIPVAADHTTASIQPWPYSLEVELPYVYALPCYAPGPGTSYRAVLQVIDVSTPTAPALLGSLDPVDYSWPQMAVRDGYAYVAGPSTITVIDVRDPAAPRIVRRSVEPANPGGWVPHVSVCGDSLCAVYGSTADHGVRLNVFSLEDPASPRFETGAEAPRSSSRLTADDHCAYVLSEEHGVPGGAGGGIWTLETPVRDGILGLTGAADTVDTYWGAVAASNGYAATLGDGSNILQLFDVRDPANPRSLGWFEIALGDQGTPSLAMSGRYAYATLENAHTLQIVDLGLVG